MKTVPVLILFLVCATAGAQVLPPSATPKTSAFSGNNGLTFEAKLISSGGSVKTDRGLASGATFQKLENTQTHESKSRVEVVVRNLGAAPAQAHFDWFFIARDVQSRREYVWDQGQRDVPLNAGAQKKELLESKPVTETTRQKTEYTQPSGAGPQQAQQQSSKDQTGARPFGWIVRLVEGERVLQVQASSNDLESVGRDQARLSKLTQAPVGPR